MSTLDKVLLVLLIGMTSMYLTAKFKSKRNVKVIMSDIKDDFVKTTVNLTNIACKAKGIIFDSSILNIIKELILMVEEANRSAKLSGERLLSGSEKKQAVIENLTNWTSRITGSAKDAVEFVETNKVKIEEVIDDYVNFSNKMMGKEQSKLT